jgi:hypothetical protein
VGGRRTEKKRERIDAGGSFDFGFERERKGSVVVGGDGRVEEEIEAERADIGSDVGDCEVRNPKHREIELTRGRSKQKRKERELRAK